MASTYVLKSFKRSILMEDIPMGYIVGFKNTSDECFMLWGSDSYAYYWVDLGAETTSLDFKTYADGLAAATLVNSVGNIKDISVLTEAVLDYPDVDIDLDFFLIGITPSSLDAGITETTSSDSITIPSEVYKAYARKNGWVFNVAAVYVLCTAPQVYVNFLSYFLIGNFIEITLEENADDATKVDVTTSRVKARLRWGDTGSSICGELVAEDPETNNAGYVDLIETPGPIVGALSFSDRVIAFKPKAIYELVYSGYPKYFTPSLVVSDVGLLAPKSLEKFGDSCVFVGRENIYTFTPGVGAGGLKSIGSNIKLLLFGYNADYYITDLENTVVQVYEERKEIWVWIPTIKGVASSIVWKYNGQGWTKTDYSLYGYGMLKYIEKDYYIDGSSNEYGFVPVLFFDVGNNTDIVIEDSTSYVGRKKVTLKAYYDLQSSFNSCLSSFQTIDYPLEKDSRVIAFLFQGLAYSTTGTVSISYSLDEGRTWVIAKIESLKYSIDFIWYEVPINVTAESIRFKFETYTEIGIGKMELRVSVRERGGIYGQA